MSIKMTKPSSSYNRISTTEPDHEDSHKFSTATQSGPISPELISSFSEIVLQQSGKATVIKNREKSGKINATQATNELKKAYTTLAHTLDKEQLEYEYKTSVINGLATQQITEAYADPKIGYNELIPPKRDPEWLRFMKSTFGNLLSIFWTGCAILSIFLYCIDPREPPNDSSLFLGIFLIIVILLTGGFIFYVDGKASNLMSSLSSIDPKSIIVIRNNGAKDEIEPKYLVPGDIIQLTMGMSLPADIRVIECSSDMQVDNSSLTGESEPQQRSYKKETNDIIPAESKCLSFYGTFILNGNGIGMVIATGNNTFMGRTAALASYTQEITTPLMMEINNLVIKLSGFAAVIALCVFIPAMVLNPQNWMGNLMILVSLVLTNIPGGLLVVTCVQLTLTAKVLFRKNVQIKQLGSVETMGSCTVICSDKTGTLTTNVMTAQHIYYNMKQCICDTIDPMHALKGDFYYKNDRSQPNDNFLKLVRCGSLCNNASFMESSGEIDPTANATEAAILKFCSGHIGAYYKCNMKDYRNKHKKLHEIPFNSRNKWQVSIHELPVEDTTDFEDTKTESNAVCDKKQCIVQMKGAPERILDLCDRYASNGEVFELDSETRTEIMNNIMDLGSKGERVLAFAELILGKEYNINISEPNIEQKYEDSIDETYAAQNVVVISYENKKYIINMDIITDGKAFEELTIDDVMQCIAMNNEIESESQIPIAMQRIAYGDGLIENTEQTFKELGIKQGSLLYLFVGPYLFMGSGMNDANWPFYRKDRDNECGLIFIGLFAMIDPPRPGVPNAIQTCQTAGIKVIMVTGDHPITAKAIAQMVGILKGNSNEQSSENKEDSEAKILIYDSENAEVMKQFKDKDFDGIVVPGWELQNILDKEPDSPQLVADFWNIALNCNNIVFARTSPQQKLLIVSAVQERGGIVAVTGDGVNDSPALKKANIGVAMGITGTQVAKESANMILLDDDFSTIIIGIKQGRILFDNLKKSICYSLGKCMGQIIPFVVTIGFGLPLPLTPLLLVTIDGGTDLIPAMSLCMECAEDDIMHRRPRDAKTEHLATLKLIFNTHLVYGIFGACAGLFGYFTVLHSFGFLPAHVINGLDEDQIFSFNGDRSENALRDGYYLWCFKPEITEKCYYYPNFLFGNESLININTRNNPKSGVYYYDQNQWFGYQMNDANYAKQSKQYLNWLNSDLSLNQLNGLDKSGNKCCNIGIGGNDCAQTSECKSDYLDWNTFYNQYWIVQNGLNDTFSKNVFTNDKIFKNRRCEAMDYFHLYNDQKYKDQPILSCNSIDHGRKPRTYADTVYSLFPIHTRTRTEALSTAQTALVMGIFMMQLAHLLTVRTRRSSIFQQGMGNQFMNYGLLFQIFLISFIIYIPWMNVILGSRPLRFVFWTPAMPFVIFIVFLHECRKGIIRKDQKQNGFITRNTYW